MAYFNTSNYTPDGSNLISFTRSVYDIDNPAPVLGDVSVREIEDKFGTNRNINLDNPSWLTINTTNRSVSNSPGVGTRNYLDLEFVIDTADCPNNEVFEIDYNIIDNGGEVVPFSFNHFNGFFDPTSPLNADVILSARYESFSGSSEVKSSITNYGSLGGTFDLNGSNTVEVFSEVTDSVAGNRTVRSKGFGYYDFSGNTNVNQVNLTSSFSDFFPTVGDPAEPFTIFILADWSSNSGNFITQGTNPGGNENRVVYLDSGNDFRVYTGFGGGGNQVAVEAGGDLREHIGEFCINYNPDTDGFGNPIVDHAAFDNGTRRDERTNVTDVCFYPSGNVTLFESNSITVNELYELYIYRSQLTNDQFRQIRQGISNVYSSFVDNNGTSIAA